MAKHDRHFTTVFGAVLGILIAITLLILGISRGVDDEPTGSRDTTDPLMRAAADERIEPFGRVAVAGQDNAALVIPASPAAATASAATVLLPADGKATYEQVCAVCHAAGIAGAPKTGDRSVWAARIAQGMATLNRHAVEGYQGPAGVMPAKGGRLDLTDELVEQAVDYMVAQSR